MSFENQFGSLERLLHVFSFRSGFSQRMLADLEDTLFAKRIGSVEIDRPVFVTGLPRSGTTILLEMLVESGHFASHTYRDMPFVLCPLLWSKFSRHFSRDAVVRERAHGDGIQIASGSPEAFEEILWKEFWPDHYGPDRIAPWQPSESNEEFDEFFRHHMAKVILIRLETDERRRRYVSKNNVNIARLGSPSLPLREGISVVPFRDPYQHAASMHRQHRRFSKLQAEDRFARRYMEGIGHHDFGLGLKPIDFGGWLTGAEDPDRVEFWVRYWSAAYEAVLSRRDERTRLFSYDRLVHRPEDGLRRLAVAVDVPEMDLASLAPRIGRPRSYETPVDELERGTLSRAREIHRELVRVADMS